MKCFGLSCKAATHLQVRLDAMGFNVSAPHMHATCLEALDLQPGHAFLDIGSGCGLVTAAAAFLVRPQLIGKPVYGKRGYAGTHAPAGGCASRTAGAKCHSAWPCCWRGRLTGRSAQHELSASSRGVALVR